MKTAIVLGANSAIAREYLKQSLHRFSYLVICGRSNRDLQILAGDLMARNPRLAVMCVEKDLSEVDGIPEIWREMVAFCGRVDEVLLAAGVLPDQAAQEVSPVGISSCFMVNSVVPTIWALQAALTFEQQKSGIVCVITSVAGDRGRKSNYIYGSAKAQLMTFCEGLRCRLAKSGAEVLDFRPGMVKSPMTEKLKQSPLMASPVTVGGALAKRMETGRGGVLYSPNVWRLIMVVIRHIPYSIFKKTNF